MAEGSVLRIHGALHIGRDLGGLEVGQGGGDHWQETRHARRSS